MSNPDSPTLVLLHGWGNNITTWKHFETVLAENNFKFVSIKMPGFDLPEPDSPWGVPEYANYVLEFLENTNVKPPYIFVGHSFGGRIAIYVASTRPQIVKGLVLTSAAGVENRKTPKIIAVGLLSKVFKFLANVKGVNKVSNKLRDRIWQHTSSSNYRKASPTMREVLKRVVSLNLRSYLKSINAKTLIMWGEKDNITPLSEAKTLHRGIKDSQLIVLKNGEHFVHLTHAFKWEAHVLSFLKELLI